MRLPWKKCRPTPRRSSSSPSRCCRSRAASAWAGAAARASAPRAAALLRAGETEVDDAADRRLRRAADRRRGQGAVKWQGEYDLAQVDFVQFIESRQAYDVDVRKLKAIGGGLYTLPGRLSRPPAERVDVAKLGRIDAEFVSDRDAYLVDESSCASRRRSDVDALAEGLAEYKELKARLLIEAAIVGAAISAALLRSAARSPRPSSPASARASRTCSSPSRMRSAPTSRRPKRSARRVGAPRGAARARLAARGGQPRRRPRDVGALDRAEGAVLRRRRRLPLMQTAAARQAVCAPFGSSRRRARRRRSRRAGSRRARSA